MNPNEFITFPIELEIIPNEKNAHIKHVKIIENYPNWKTLKRKVPQNDLIHYGIITGIQNNITVLECESEFDFEEEFNFDLYRIARKTLMYRTPSGGMQFYFQYEPNLNTIYDLFPGVCILNNSAYALGGRPDYRRQTDNPIQKMPEILYNCLENAQKDSEMKIKINQKIYDLYNILPIEYCNDIEIVMILINAIRNTKMIPNNIRFNTINKLLKEKESTVFEENELKNIFTTKLTNEQKDKLSDVKEFINEEFPDEYNNWIDKYGTNNIYQSKNLIKLNNKFVYKPGSCERLDNIKKIDGSLNSKKLIQINEKFTSHKKTICKSCMNIHQQGCCSKYTRTNRTTRVFIDNIAIE